MSSMSRKILLTERKREIEVRLAFICYDRRSVEANFNANLTPISIGKEQTKMERMKSRWLWLMTIIIVMSLSLVPFFEIVSAEKQTIYVVDCDGQPISDMSVVREWQSLLHENAPHSRAILSDSNGIAEFPAEAVPLNAWQITLGLALKLMSLTNPHADDGKYNAYIAGGKSVYPDANESPVKFTVCRR